MRRYDMRFGPECKFKNSFVGIATGPDFGWVLDADPRHGGLETLAALEAKHGKLPETLTGDQGQVEDGCENEQARRDA